MRCHVYHPDFDRIVFMVSAEQAEFMVRHRQAEPLRRGTLRRGIRLTTAGAAHPCRTFVSVANSADHEPGPLQIMRGSGGGSQQYVTHDHRGRVNGFKRIHAEDKPVFFSATLDCLEDSK